VRDWPHSSFSSGCPGGDCSRRLGRRCRSAGRLWRKAKRRRVGRISVSVIRRYAARGGGLRLPLRALSHGGRDRLTRPTNCQARRAD
jgi:hypothetical protein